MTQFVEQLRNQAKWYTQPGHNARDLMDSHLLEKAVDEIECLRAKIAEMEQQEPTRDWWDCLIADISTIDCMYRGSPTYAHDAYWMREHVVRMLEQRRDALHGAQTQGEGK